MPGSRLSVFSVPDECSFSVVLDRTLSWASLLKITGRLEAFEGAIRGGGVDLLLIRELYKFEIKKRVEGKSVVHRE